VSAGIDRLVAQPDRWLEPGSRVALLSNQSALCGDGRTTLEALLECDRLELRALLSAEHGWSGFADDATPIEDRRHQWSGLPVYSLYGPRRSPPEGLELEVDAVVVDLLDVGVRCYTYAATVALLLEWAATTGTRVVVCDRPNPLGSRMAGPPLDPRFRSFLGYLDVPYVHGLTLGELARVHSARALGGGVDLEVVTFPGPPPNQPRPEPWIPPSPGLPAPDAVSLYPGLVLLEGTNVSEGRGTPLPFQVLGAPWLDGYALARELREATDGAVLFRPLSFRPDSGKLAGRTCHGVQLHLVDRNIDALATMIAVLAVLRHHDEFIWVDSATLPWSSLPDAGRPWHEPAGGLLVDHLTGNEEVRRLVEGAPAEPITERWSAYHWEFRRSVGKELLYSATSLGRS
jgi:uncharacterized protein YbbC (DUF1343 family)